MKVLMISLIYCIIFVQSGFSLEEPIEVPVESFLQVDPSEFNETIVEAAIAGETWPGNQISVAVRFLGGAVVGRYISITKVDNRGECADTSIVTIIQDGFLDDSMRGQWDMIFLYLNDNNWIIFESRRAWRCWRGDYQIESFGSSMCQ